MNMKLIKLLRILMTVFIVIGVVMGIIFYSYLVKIHTNISKAIEITASTFSVLGMILLIVDSSYIHLFYKRYLVMAIEISCCLGMIAGEVLLPFKTLIAIKLQLMHIIVLFAIIFVITRFLNMRINREY